VFYYLNRPISPHIGDWGQDSTADPRTVPCGG